MASWCSLVFQLGLWKAHIVYCPRDLALHDMRCFSIASNTNPVNEQDIIYAYSWQLTYVTVMVRADVSSVPFDLSHMAIGELQQLPGRRKEADLNNWNSVTWLRPPQGSLEKLAFSHLTVCHNASRMQTLDSRIDSQTCFSWFCLLTLKKSSHYSPPHS